MLDTERLPGDAQQRVTDLVQGVAFFGLAPALFAPARIPDAHQYRVRIEDGERAHEVAFDDGCVQLPLLELVECVTELAKAGS